MNESFILAVFVDFSINSSLSFYTPSQSSFFFWKYIHSYHSSKNFFFILRILNVWSAYNTNEAPLLLDHFFCKLTSKLFSTKQDLTIRWKTLSGDITQNHLNGYYIFIQENFFQITSTTTICKPLMFEFLPQAFLPFLLFRKS